MFLHDVDKMIHRHGYGKIISSVAYTAYYGIKYVLLLPIKAFSLLTEGL